MMVAENRGEAEQRLYGRQLSNGERDANEIIALQRQFAEKEQRLEKVITEQRDTIVGNQQINDTLRRQVSDLESLLADDFRRRNRLEAERAELLCRISELEQQNGRLEAAEKVVEAAKEVSKQAKKQGDFCSYAYGHCCILENIADDLDAALAEMDVPE